MALLFISVFTKAYFAPLFSSSSCVCLAILIFVFVIPFFAAISTDEFWTTYQIYTEQPSIIFNNEVILYVLENDTPRYYSSIIEPNNYASNPINSTTLKVTKYDNNNDGIINSVNVRLSFPMDPSSIKNVKLMLFFNLILQNYVKLEMKTMAYIDINTNYGASYIYINGNLNLQQYSPIAYGTITRALYNTTIFDDTTSPYDFVGIYENFNKRNITTKFDFDKYIYPYMYTNEVVLDINVNYPSYQPIFAVSNIIIVLQNAWGQYLCIFIFVASVVYYLTFYIFKNQIFQTYVVEDLPNYHPLKSR